MAESSAPSPCLRVLDTAIVRPSGDPLPPSSLPLTIFDLTWIHSPPVERIFFYRITDDPAKHQLAGATLSKLKDSLSTALRIFFPLCGHVRITPGSNDTRYDIFYEPGDGIAFTLAEYNADVSDLSSYERPRQVAELTQLVPRLTSDAGAALLAVQVTMLHGGLALGVTVHHASCDGTGSTNLMHTWAAACNGTEFPAAPVIDRTLIADPQGLYAHLAKNLPTAEQLEFVKMSPDQLLATFTVSREHLQRIKDVVAGEATLRDHHPPPRCSTLVAAFGLIWSCYCRTKEETGWSAVAGRTGNGAEPAYFLLPVNRRPLMKPPVPPTYLGNCIGPAIGAAPRKELASGGTGGLFTACAAVAAGIHEAVVTPGCHMPMERMKEVTASACVLSVAGSPRFHVYDVDLGFGRPLKVEIVSVARTGAMAVAESDGLGMEVGISLPPAAMEVFRRCFADAIMVLSPPHHTG